MNKMNLDRITYETNFLENVIFRIDYSPILRMIKETPADFQTKIKGKFPRLREETIIELSRGITKKSDTESQSHEEKQIRPVWKFFSKDQTQMVELTYNTLAVEFSKYSNFEEFRDSVEHAFHSFSEIYQSIDLKRLGLRYINHIVLEKGNPFDWKNLVNPSLTHFVDNFFDDKKDLAKALSRITTNKEDFEMNFLWGWHNTEFPSKIARRQFILDYDCYTHDVEEQNVVNLIEKFHDQIHSYFEKSIGDDLRKIMKGDSQ